MHGLGLTEAHPLATLPPLRLCRAADEKKKDAGANRPQCLGPIRRSPCHTPWPCSRAGPLTRVAQSRCQLELVILVLVDQWKFHLVMELKLQLLELVELLRLVLDQEMVELEVL